MRVSCNAIDITGGHEDAIGYNPEQKVLSNADYADSGDEIVKVMREQRKQDGADFTKIYETGPDSLIGNTFTVPYQFTQEELEAAAVKEAHRTGSRVAVHATGEPGTGFAAEAGVASIDHAYNLSPATMKLMKQKQIYAVPTFAIMEYFAQHPRARRRRKVQGDFSDFHAAQFKLQMKARESPSPSVPTSVPFPHGTQAREYELMVQYGMSSADTLRAALLNGAKLLDWEGQIGQLKPGFYADVIAVPGNPLGDITVLKHHEYGDEEWRTDPKRIERLRSSRAWLQPTFSVSSAHRA